jgi:DNA-damage-inducible protein J
MSIQIKGEKMPKTATIQARIDPKIKEEAQKVFKKLNISLSEAISIFFTQVSLNKGIPFEIKIPNETTEKTLLKSEKGEELHEVKNTKELLEGVEN